MPSAEIERMSANKKKVAQHEHRFLGQRNRLNIFSCTSEKIKDAAEHSYKDFMQRATDYVGFCVYE